MDVGVETHSSDQLLLIGWTGGCAGDWSWSGSGTRQIIHSQIPTSSAVSAPAQKNVKRTLDTSEKLLRCPLSNLYKDYLIIENELHLQA